MVDKKEKVVEPDDKTHKAVKAVEVNLEHRDGSRVTVLKPSAEYTNFTGVYGWKEV